jgi:hypothetical protein
MDTVMANCDTYESIDWSRMLHGDIVTEISRGIQKRLRFVAAPPQAGP